MKNKKQVKYIPTQYDYIKVGEGATVYPVDHTSPYVDNGRICWTSLVLSKQEDGTFETENSIYTPVKE